jgi:hypothetical protein
VGNRFNEEGIAIGPLVWTAEFSVWSISQAGEWILLIGHQDHCEESDRIELIFREFQRSGI